MLLWVKLLIGITLAVGAQNEGQPSQLETTEPPPDFVNHDSPCFNVKAEACSPELKDPCSCKNIDDHSVVCCNVANSNDLKNKLRCASENLFHYSNDFVQI